MIEIRQVNGSIQVSPNVRGFMVHVDDAILGKIAGTERGERFRKFICDKGTLCLFLAGSSDLFAMEDGPEFERIRGYLQGFGHHFVFLDSNGLELLQREMARITGRNLQPALYDFPLQLLAKYCPPSETPTVGHLLTRR